MVVGTGCVDRRTAGKLDSGVRTSAVSEGPKIGAATAVAARERFSSTQTREIGRSGRKSERSPYVLHRPRAGTARMNSRSCGQASSLGALSSEADTTAPTSWPASGYSSRRSAWC